jgi:hypothetical protein
MKTSYSIYKEWSCIPPLSSGIQKVEAIPHSAQRGAIDAKEANERHKYWPDAIDAKEANKRHKYWPEE